MLQKVTSRLFFFLLLSLPFVIGGSSEAAGGKDKLKPQEQKVIDYLRKDWDEDYSVTSVEIGMNAVGLKQSDESRFRIGSYIKARPELHEVIRRWGWVTLVLTPDEKLIARVLVNAQRDGKPSPSVAEIARAVEISEDQAKRGLAMLQRYEIIERDRSLGGAGYKVLPKYLKWEPRLDFLFHKVTIAGGRQFNTNWAVDFMLLVSSKLANEKVTVDDSSPESTARIHAVFEKGKLSSVEPSSTIVFAGGGWGVTNLFRSEEALQEWLKRYPELKDKMHGPIPLALEFIKARQKS